MALADAILNCSSSAKDLTDQIEKLKSKGSSLHWKWLFLLKQKCLRDFFVYRIFQHTEKCTEDTTAEQLIQRSVMMKIANSLAIIF